MAAPHPKDGAVGQKLPLKSKAARVAAGAAEAEVGISGAKQGKGKKLGGEDGKKVLPPGPLEAAPGSPLPQAAPPPSPPHSTLKGAVSGPQSALKGAVSGGGLTGAASGLKAVDGSGTAMLTLQGSQGGWTEGDQGGAQGGKGSVGTRMLCF